MSSFICLSLTLMKVDILFQLLPLNRLRLRFELGIDLVMKASRTTSTSPQGDDIT